MKILLLILSGLLFSNCYSFSQIEKTLSKEDLNQLILPFDQNDNTTATYNETIEFYTKAAKLSPNLQLKEYGITDSGQPLHLAILSLDKDFDPVSIRKSGKQILMVNNAIHPGEPCGVDASMMIFEKIFVRFESSKVS